MLGGVKNQQRSETARQPTHDLADILSFERLEKYLAAAGENTAQALELYALNTAVSECLYTSLQMLEVALRNRFHVCLSDRYGEEWFDELGVITTPHQRRKISEAKIELVVGKKEITPGRIVASLSFGFWTTCLGIQYEDSLWRPALSRAFAHKPNDIGRRKINSELTPIRLLRNRIAHHEPVLRWNLPKHHANMLKITGWLCPEAATWTEQHCRFSKVFDPDLAGLFQAE